MLSRNLTQRKLNQEGDITTFAEPVKEFRGYTLKLLVSITIVQANLKNKSSFHIFTKTPEHEYKLLTFS